MEPVVILNCRGEKIMVDGLMVEKSGYLSTLLEVSHEKKLIEQYVNCRAETMHELLDVIVFKGCKTNRQDLKSLADFLDIDVELETKKSFVFHKTQRAEKITGNIKTLSENLRNCLFGDIQRYKFINKERFENALWSYEQSKDSFHLGHIHDVLRDSTDAMDILDEIFGL
jgi:hypothetical protein